MKVTKNPESKGELIEALATDVTEFIEREPRLFFNECDMQVRLCVYLQSTGHYEAVVPEYRIPLAELVSRGVPGTRDGKKWIMTGEFPWNNDIFADIVVKSHGQYACVELKYATAQLRNSLTLFDEPLLGNEEIIKTQAASNLVMYSYWKDVRRIEVITEKFHNVAGGVALLVTNDNTYWDKPRDNAKYLPFSTHADREITPGALVWNGQLSSENLKSHMPFHISGRYVCNWHPAGVTDVSRKGHPFKYILNIINKLK
ncbi:hypothetical protein EEL49_01790 [Muribaculaceae bacterium Isolate-104 (HZI)]|nr:hypothetical protein EEL49_01790 [Muribaculaceae bacterium Isolate-104 (HZI)]